MNKKIICPKCGFERELDEYYKFKNQEPYIDMCKDCVCDRISVNKPETFLPFMELFDIPYIKRQWNLLVARAERGDPFRVASANKVFGKYLSQMKLKGYKHLGFKDTEQINAHEDKLDNFYKSKNNNNIQKVYEIYYDDDIKSYVAIPYDKDGYRKAIANHCNITIKDLICTGTFTCKYGD